MKVQWTIWSFWSTENYIKNYFPRNSPDITDMKMLIWEQLFHSMLPAFICSFVSNLRKTGPTREWNGTADSLPWCHQQTDEAGRPRTKICWHYEANDYIRFNNVDVSLIWSWLIKCFFLHIFIYFSSVFLSVGGEHSLYIYMWQCYINIYTNNNRIALLHGVVQQQH